MTETEAANIDIEIGEQGDGLGAIPEFAQIPSVYDNTKRMVIYGSLSLLAASFLVWMYATSKDK